MLHASRRAIAARALGRTARHVTIDANVRQLNLQWNGIGREGAQRVADSLVGSNVLQLDIRHNDIGSEGAKSIAAALDRCELTTLVADFNGLGDHSRPTDMNDLSGFNVLIGFNDIGDDAF